MKEDSYSNSTLISSSLRESNKFNTNYNRENMMSPKGYKNDKNSTSPAKSDNNNNDNNDSSHVSTPRNSLSNKDQTANTDNYPMTPSPPNKIRRSSASMSFLATPKFNSLNNIEQQQLSHKKMNSHNSSDNEEEEEDSNDAAVAFSPIAHNSTRNTRLLPPTTPKSRNMESALLSPTPHITSPSVYKESNKPIREISNNLKARLNYAFVKLQNGWVDRTLPELENELDRQQILIQQRHNLQQLQQQSSPQRSIYLSPAHSISSSYTNQFAYGNGISTDGDHNESFDNDAKFDYGDKAERSDSTNSARLAFMKALSSPARGGNISSSSTINDTSMGRQPHPASLSMNFNSRDSTLSSTKTSATTTNGSSTSSSPLKWSNNRSSKAAMNSFQEQRRDIKQIKTVKKKDGSIEVAAIETLMSLSSPKKSNPSASFNDKNNNSEQDTDNDTEIDEEDYSETKTTKQLR
ncbi:hypothetical protein C6P45_004768 [Maudiozyma exigua]|uniref:Uncharacterized protein n=1 Tax=Maudiozyma exigua TaxID=34358 RepID=A0A9P6WE77_MAUEX|nr:hypothetical protein C6P45_004768 [Kazachstania exigua]